MMKPLHCMYSALRRLIALMAIVLSAASLYAQELTVKGSVTDEAGDPLMGVAVLEKGTTRGTMTNTQGKFTLKVKNGKAVLRLTSIGYKSLELPVDGHKELKVVMKEEATSLNEVVVGYGSMGKKELTSAVSHVSAKNFTQVASVDPWLPGGNIHYFCGLSVYAYEATYLDYDPPRGILLVGSCERL